MSYILDALRKSEKERQQGTVPDFMTVQDAMVQEPKKRLLLPYLLIVSLLINSALFVWWLVPWQSKKSGQMTSYSTARQQPESKEVALPSKDSTKTSGPEAKINRDTPVAESEIIALKKESKTQTTINQQQQVSVATDLQEKISNSISAVNKESLREITPVVSQQTRTIHQFSSEPKSTQKSVAHRENNVYNIEDLPLSIQQNLPPITISVSLYSNEPASRMARINGSMIREGEYLTAGLKLEEITPDGVIFSYQNYRFHVGPK
jgi:general secretion pathway protein B